MVGHYTLEEAQEEAMRLQPVLPTAELRQMCSDPSERDRLLALFVMRRQTAEQRLDVDYLELAKSLIEDENNDCRWQALIVIGEFIPADPEAVWRVVARYGVSDDPDMRMAVATVLLEHLIELFPATFRRWRSNISVNSSLA